MIVSVDHGHRFADKLKDMGIDVGEWYEPGGHAFDARYIVSEPSGISYSFVLTLHRAQKRKAGKNSLAE